MIWRRSLCLALLLIYGFLFYYQERFFQNVSPHLAFPLPPTVQKAVLGFLRQLGGEMHFIKTSVFTGGLHSSSSTDTYANSLARNLEAAVELHPYFIDTYFLCEANLPHLGSVQARETNVLLEKGMTALPDQWILPFFAGFNHFYYLKENHEAAGLLLLASNLPGSAPWLGHLASMLAAEGGDIYAGLMWLKAMLQSEDDEATKERYQNDIAAFEKALAVQKAVFVYRNQYGEVPAKLNDLIPEFLLELPDFNGRFYLDWEPPVLRLQRPHRKVITK